MNSEIIPSLVPSWAHANSTNTVWWHWSNFLARKFNPAKILAGQSKLRSYIIARMNWKLSTLFCCEFSIGLLFLSGFLISAFKTKELWLDGFTEMKPYSLLERNMKRSPRVYCALHYSLPISNGSWLFSNDMQLLDSDWPAKSLAGFNFRAQEIRSMSPDGVVLLAQARLGTRLNCPLVGCSQLVNLSM